MISKSRSGNGEGDEESESPSPQVSWDKKSGELTLPREMCLDCPPEEGFLQSDALSAVMISLLTPQVNLGNMLNLIAPHLLHLQSADNHRHAS